MKCPKCGEKMEKRYYELHKRQFCQPSFDFELKKFFKWKPFIYTMLGLIIWTAFWLVYEFTR